MSIFSSTSVQKRRQKLQHKWDSVLATDQAVLVFSGNPIQRPGGLDQTYKFLPHPEYYWLTGNRNHGAAVFYSKDLGWIDFDRPITAEEILWDGAVPTKSAKSNIADLPNFLQTLKFKHVVTLGRMDHKNLKFDIGGDSNAEVAGSVSSFRKLKFDLQIAIDKVRRVKDGEEIEMIRKASSIANFGYEKIRTILRPGISEREVQIEYEAETFRKGSHATPYDSLVGAGKRSAILHSTPTEALIAKDDLVLIDAGVDLYDYCVDITRVYAASGKFTTQQSELYSIVKQAQAESVDLCKAEVEWHDIHRHSAKVISEGLVKLGLMKGSVDSILESGAIAMFFPHGVGHMVGLRVRDVGTIHGQTTRKCCGVNVRVDFKIQPGHVLTVEPGCYFNESLFRNEDKRNQFKDFVNFSELEKWWHVGGVRIEDDILITEGEPENLTGNVVKV